MNTRFWLLTLAAALALGATLAAGAWQLGRARQKIALEASVAERKRLPPVDAAALLGATDTARLFHRKVSLRGHWMAGHTVFLDNRQMRGQPGFYVVTPLRLEGGDAAVLVQRGWVPRNFLARDHLPRIDTPGGSVQVNGRIAPAPGKLYEFGAGGRGPIRQNLDLADFRAETGLALPDLSVQQTGAPSDGLLRDWPVAGSGIDKHYGYAFQWWALSALITLLYVWFQFILPRRKASHG